MPAALPNILHRSMTVKTLLLSAIIFFALFMYADGMGQGLKDSTAAAVAPPSHKPLKCDTCCPQKDLIDFFFQG